MSKNIENEMNIQPIADEPKSLSDSDKMVLELANMRRQLAQVQIEKATAQQEVADLAYRYIVLQIYMKYGLSETDSINEQGVIVSGSKE